MAAPHDARAEASSQPLADYLDAFAALDRHELAALTLTLGVILFAVVTAIVLLRTRTRPAAGAGGARRRDHRPARGARPRRRAAACPSRNIVVWPAGADEPDIIGDAALVTRTAVPHRVLAFGSWLEPDKAQAMEHAVDALRAEGKASR